MGGLIALFYATSILFVVVVLGSVMAFLKLNIFTMIRHLKEEYMLILGTSTAEPALPGLMRKLEHAGVKKETVGLVVPTGYSFNLDGAAIYLSLAALYIAQATNTDLTIGQQLGLLAVMLLTSKGAAGVAGGGFIALTATLTTIGTIPAAGIMLIFGIDKFMSECRALTNLCGNAVASIVVSKWEGQFDLARARRVLDGDEISDFDLLVEDDTLVTERMDDSVLAALAAAPPAATPASTRLDANGHKTGGVAVLEREVPRKAAAGPARGKAATPRATGGPRAKTAAAKAPAVKRTTRGKPGN
jgi:aerobic C4-dicarboxylate transport protein